MNTKLRFKVIASLIVLSLIAVFGWQIYWVKGLYDSIWKKTEENIYEAMKMADYKELFMRIDALKNNEDEDAPKGVDLNLGLDISKNKSDTITFEYPSKQLNPQNRLTHYLSTLKQMEGELQMLLHQTIDSILPINVAIYDSLLSAELKERNIDAPHTLQLLQLRDSIPFASMQLSSTDSTKNEFELNDKGYDYPVLTKSDQIYRLYIKSPERIVFRQMGGILLSSGLLLLLIIFSFAYLLRTILKQKTVEELKTDFTNNVTHELKTPIAVAFAANDVLLHHDSAALSEKQKKYMTIIHEQLSRLTSMVEQILTLSVENRSTFKINPENIRLADLLPSLIEQHKLKTDKEILFNIDLPEEFTIYADRTHLYNMISNLIENAVKYTPSQQVRITFTGTTNHKETTFSVTDNGMGINESNQKRIFDKFYRVPHGNLHNVKGYGLGLYYIKDIMNKHHGDVSVVSQPGKGATFTLHFKNN